jgi:UDP-N-acetyl-D-mannosaminuronic acid dehydrogenase
MVYHDPYVDSERMDLQPLDDAIADADAIVIATDHDEYSELDPAAFRSAVNHPLVLDSHAILDAESWTNAVFDVIRL